MGACDTPLEWYHTRGLIALRASYDIDFHDLAWTERLSGNFSTPPYRFHTASVR